MKKILKKLALACGVLSLVVFVLVTGAILSPRFAHDIYAAYSSDTATGSTNLKTGNINLTDTGLYSNGTLRYQPGSPDAFTSGKVSLGTVGTALSTSSATGASAGELYYAYLVGNTAALEGSVLVGTTTAAGHGVTVCVAPAVSTQTGVVGIALAAVSTGSVVGVYSYGWVLALTTGTVNAGDALITSNLSAGYLMAPGVAPSSGTVAVALTAGVSSGGRIRVRLN